MPSSPRLRVASPSFSIHPVLRRELSERFPLATYNDGGQRLAGTALVGFLRGAEGAVIGLEPITDDVLAACPDLRIVAKYGVGLDNVDLEACRRRGVAVGWTGGVNRRSVAELVLCTMLAHCRNVFTTARLLREGEWRKDGGVQLSGRTVGIIGLGNTGREVAALLAPFHCRILGNDIIEQNDYCRDHGIEPASKDQVWAESDIITLHTPLTPLTRTMVNAKTLAGVKPGAMLINTSRGEIVDLVALKQALLHGPLGGAALDVYDHEPPTDRELLTLPNIICTPHIGGNSNEAILAMGRSAIAHLAAHFTGGGVTDSGEAAP
ncbi:MAG: phosphoglycerate dehydrogenase [Alphaproteobacteria bacterium]